MITIMKKKQKPHTIEAESWLDEAMAIEKGFEQMDMIYRSRSIPPPLGKNVTVRELEDPPEKTTE